MAVGRGQRQAVTSRTIEQKAVELVLEHGLDQVTVDMICEASGVSQRTFFNYFSTKNAAILGSVEPRLDEAAVRRFLASDNDDLLVDLLPLVIGLAPFDPSDPALAADRMRIITRTPALLNTEMERLFAIQQDVQEVLTLRLRRHAARDETEQETRELAILISHFVAGILRYSIENAGQGSAPGPPDPVRIQGLLRSAMARLLPPTD
jgi:AcrR family transcriptional regulator